MSKLHGEKYNVKEKIRIVNFIINIVNNFIHLSSEQINNFSVLNGATVNCQRRKTV